MSDIDAGKLARVQEAAGWLKQFEVFHRALRYELASDCITRARAALSDPIFDRQPIAGFARNQQPEVVRIVADNPLGFAIINGMDFDQTVHQLYVEPEKSSKRIR
jgi:hypothetical protein